MLDHGMDQAAGLRRWVEQAPAGPRLVALALPEEGGGDDWIAGMAHALRAAGARPVVVDASRGRLMQAFGLRPRHDLIDLLQGSLAFEHVACRTDDGVYVVRADRGVEAFVASGAPPQQLFAGFTRLSQGFDAILLAMPLHELACLAPPPQAVPVLALEPGEEGLTRAYATVKALGTGYGYSRFAPVLQRADGAAAHARLAQAAQRFLRAEVLPGAHLPAAAAELLRTAATPLPLH